MSDTNHVQVYVGQVVTPKDLQNFLYSERPVLFADQPAVSDYKKTQNQNKRRTELQN